MRILITCALVTFAGCATLEHGADQVRDFAHEHPVVTAIAAGAAAGAIVAAADRHHHHGGAPDRRQDHGLRTHECAPVPHGDVYLPPMGDPEVCR